MSSREPLSSNDAEGHKYTNVSSTHPAHLCYSARMQWHHRHGSNYWNSGPNTVVINLKIKIYIFKKNPATSLINEAIGTIRRNDDIVIHSPGPA